MGVQRDPRKGRRAVGSVFAGAQSPGGGSGTQFTIQHVGGSFRGATRGAQWFRVN